MSNIYTREEVNENNTKESCWIIANNIVYDVTSYINKHPGGKFAILSKGGTDVTKHFAWHTKRAKKLWDKRKIGIVPHQSKNCCL